MNKNLELGTYIAKQRLLRKKYIPLVLMLEPLFECNLNCCGCGRIREYRKEIHKRMSLDECVEAVEECDAPVVSICGGEPLLYLQLEELLKIIVFDKKKYVYLCTNGTILNQSIAKLPINERFSLNVHLDGTQQVHDRVCGNFGVYRLVVQGIKLAIALGINVTVNTTVSKNTDMNDVERLFENMQEIGVASFTISPAYCYESVKNNGYFMNRSEVREKLSGIKSLAEKFNLLATPTYLDFLTGKINLKCTPWGSPTRNPMGWRAPCYLIADTHYSTFRELVEKTDWNMYGRGNDSRCEDCMVHCGFEPTAALGGLSFLKALKWISKTR